MAEAEDLKRALIDSGCISPSAVGTVLRSFNSVALVYLGLDKCEDHSESALKLAALRVGKSALAKDHVLESVRIFFIPLEHEKNLRTATVRRYDYYKYRLLSEEMASSMVRVSLEPSALDRFIAASKILPSDTAHSVHVEDSYHPESSCTVRIGKLDEIRTPELVKTALKIAKLILMKDETFQIVATSFHSVGLKIGCHRAGLELLEQGLITEYDFIEQTQVMKIGASRHMI